MYSMCLVRKIPAFFPYRKLYNVSLKRNMAEAELSSMTFTSSDSDYDISLRIPLKMKTKIKIIYTEASSDNYHQTQKAMQSLKSAGVQ